MSNILVVVESFQGAFRKASLEAISAAKKISADLNASVNALVLGNNVSDKAAQLGEYGAEQVFVAQSDSLEYYDSELYKAVVLDAVNKAGADIVILSATTSGKDLAPRIGARLSCGLASDCTGINVVDGSIQVERPMYAGKLFTTLKITSQTQVISLRPGVFDAAVAESGKTASVEEIALPQVDKKVALKEFRQKGGDKLDVSDADIIVTGGRGVRSAENFNVIEELAGSLDAAVGATRAVVDSGWRPHDEQVGQTGKVVSPNLYFMCGASGSIQHWAGMSGSKCIVAINKDPEAPIMKRADYSIVGDLFEVVPALTTEIKKIRG